ncbi:hypothetical protein Dimus_017967 [Dionaea muscipula]
MAAIGRVIWLLVSLILVGRSLGETYSSRLIHRFSDEAKAQAAGQGKEGFWPTRKSMEYYQMLLTSDFQRQQIKLGPKYQLLVSSEGSQTISSGNELGWLHYTWIDIGTPYTSFFVALDAGSDLLWIPCDCIQCASLSASPYSNLDRNLNEYSPANSSTSRHLACSHALCELGSSCHNSGQQCPYMAQYYTENTSSSGLLVEDVLHLSSSSGNFSKASVQASIIIGCGRNQTGGYLDGVAPDGVMGLGLGEIAVPSFLAKSGLVRNSFSLCFNEDGSGTMFFGDHGLTSQQTTSFLLLNGKYSTYIVGVEACCVGKDSCLKQTNFEALVDSGSSFTFLPEAVYEKVVQEFDRQVNATREYYEGYPWKYCYKSSVQENLHSPSVVFVFKSNSSFVIRNPLFPVHGDQGIIGYCLAIQSIEGGIAVIGQNFITGYQMVFDRENMKLGWSHSDCQDRSKEKTIPLPSPSGRPPTPLPTNEQQSTSNGHTGAPAFARKAPPKASNAPSECSPLLLLFLVQVILLLRLWLPEHETHFTVVTWLWQCLFHCHSTADILIQ